MYIHKSIKYKQIDMKIEKKEFQEAIFAEITLNNLDKLLCACFYRRGGGAVTEIMSYCSKQ